MNTNSQFSTWSTKSAAIAILFSLIIGLSVLSAQEEGGNQPSESTPPADTEGADSENPESAESESENGQQNNQSEALPRLEDLQANFPTPEELMTRKPTDWLVLKKLEGGHQVVLEVQPVAPRPDTLAQIEQAIDDYPPPPRDGTDKQKRQHMLKRELMHNISIFLPDDEKGEEFFLDYRLVDEIIYHEDKLLRWVRKYGNEGNFRQAFDLLFDLKRRVPNWPGVEDLHDQLMQIEARHYLKEGKTHTALSVLIGLYRRNRDFAGLSADFGTVINQLMDESLQQEQYRRARFYLNRLRNYFPEHELVSRWEGRLNQAARTQINTAREQFSRKEFAAALASVETAGNIWPDADGLSEAYRRIADRYQVVDVGVLEFADDPHNYPFLTDAEKRINNLTEAKLFEEQSADEVALYSSPFLSNWVPTQLGKKLTFDLRSQFQSWEPYQPLTSFDVYDALQKRLDPNSPLSDERLQSYIQEVIIRSPTRFEIIFDKVPLRPEALLAFPIEHRQVGSADEESAAPADVQYISPSRFELSSSTEKTRTYVRSTPEPDNQTLYHVAAVNEIKYDSIENAVQALIRGEVAMLPSVRGELVTLFQQDKRFFVQPRSLPQTYVLQFNPNAEMLKNRELRRALAYAIDRQQILEEIILQSPNPELGRPISAPFPTNNQAYDRLSELRPYDLTLAYSLVQAAKANLKDKYGTIRLMCVPDARIRQAAERMVLEWGRIGIEVELLDEQAETDRHNGWDIVLRQHRMAEPIVELWPYMTLRNEARAQDLLDLSSWLRQELIDLEHSGNLRNATRSLHLLHNQLQQNVEMIPLWEINDYVILRKTIANFPLTPVYPYQGIEEWTSQPFIPSGF